MAIQQKSKDILEGEGRVATTRNYVRPGEYKLRFQSVAWIEGGYTGKVGPLFTFRVQESLEDGGNKAGEQVSAIIVIFPCGPDQKAFRLGEIDSILRALGADADERKMLRDDPEGFTAAYEGRDVTLVAREKEHTNRTTGAVVTVTTKEWS